MLEPEEEGEDDAEAPATTPDEAEAEAEVDDVGSMVGAASAAVTSLKDGADTWFFLSTPMTAPAIPPQTKTI